MMNGLILCAAISVLAAAPADAGDTAATILGEETANSSDFVIEPNSETRFAIVMVEGPDVDRRMVVAPPSVSDQEEYLKDE
ncbi:MAG: hypothetical protein O2910_02010 [Proteobacteria bacterium]|jgi:hypothetical protein|nr:hypothetical protein [Pseudomonadota bacterium]